MYSQFGMLLVYQSVVFVSNGSNGKENVLTPGAMNLVHLPTVLLVTLLTPSVFTALMM